jgi:hypothetical protein
VKEGRGQARADSKDPSLKMLQPGCDLMLFEPVATTEICGYADTIPGTGESAMHFHLGKVFISHTAADKPFVRRLAARLKKSQFNVWLDEHASNGTVYASEDGNVYGIKQGGILKGKISLKNAIGAAYTPIAIGREGKLYTENDGDMFALGK